MAKFGTNRLLHEVEKWQRRKEREIFSSAPPGTFSPYCKNICRSRITLRSRYPHFNVRNKNNQAIRPYGHLLTMVRKHKLSAATSHDHVVLHHLSRHSEGNEKKRWSKERWKTTHGSAGLELVDSQRDVKKREMWQ